MTSSQDDFDQLKKLLAIKRYEQPPAAYFVHFSDRVIARIEVEECRGGASWWDWLMEKLEAKPILACAYGMAVSGLLLVGFRFSEMLDNDVPGSPLSGGLNLTSIPSQPTFPSTFGSVGLFDRSAVAYTTSLRPALRHQPLGDLYRGNSLGFQAVGFSYGR